MSSPVALIFGAGANIGAGVARAFAANGYKVAVASRSSKHGLAKDDYLHLTCDLDDLSSVTKAFEETLQALGTPGVVIYNGKFPHTPTNQAHIPLASTWHKSSTSSEDPLGLKLEDLLSDMNVNTTSAYIAAQQAASSFASLPSSASKTFIYTGNRTNIAPVPPLFSQMLGKSAAAAMIRYLSDAYKAKGYKFYYADERKIDGAPKFKVDGPAHGEFYLSLAKGEKQGPWLATFVQGTGYKDFGETSD